MLAKTPKPPYYVVIFSSVKITDDTPAYEEMTSKMIELAQLQDGFSAMESAGTELV